MLAATYVMAIGSLRLSQSHLGLALKAIREDEITAEVMGVNVRGMKLLAFVISSVLAGLSGVFFANLAGYLNPDSFTFNESSTYLLMVVLGGMGNVTGGILSAFAVTSLPEVLRFMERGRMVVYAVILLLVLRYSRILTMENLRRIVRRFRSKADAPGAPKDEVRA
jgi:branched-chain amino acid transport system permease protein